MSEEERCLLAMYFITIIVPDAIKKKIATYTKFLNWQLCIVVHDDHRFSCLRRMGLGTNMKTTERMQ